MKKSLLIFISLLFSLGLITSEAQAKRLGGGTGFGFAKNNYARQYTPPAAQKPAVPQNNLQKPLNQPQPSASTNRWLGPLAGLAAGGLLASLFFGDHFQGLQIFDFLLLGIAAWLIFSFMARRSVANASNRQAAPASSPGYSDDTAPEYQTWRGQSAVITDEQVDHLAPVSFQPAWFDEKRFLQGAQQHFLTLQRAWDKADFDEIAEYVTPEMLHHLQTERAQLAQDNHTNVLHVESFLLDLAQENGYAVASVRFDADIEENGVTSHIAEIWHVMRDLHDDDANWLIAGIQQV